MDLLNIYLYVIIFIIGTVFGSFYTLAVHRIPKGIDIIKKHSYCPNCNHKLGFFELIPVLSYIFLGGKCKKCKQKIRPRYLILEVISGVTFAALALILNINIYTINSSKMIFYVFIILYFTAIVLISAIDKEYKTINKNVLAYGIVISLAYMIYLYTIDSTSIYRYAIYLVMFMILLTIDTLFLRKLALNSYAIDLLMYLNIILIFCDAKIFYFTILVTLIIMALYCLIVKINKRKNGNKEIKIVELPIGFFIGLSNIITIFILAII